MSRRRFTYSIAAAFACLTLLGLQGTALAEDPIGGATEAVSETASVTTDEVTDPIDTQEAVAEVEETVAENEPQEVTEAVEVETEVTQAVDDVESEIQETATGSADSVSSDVQAPTSPAHTSVTETTTVQSSSSNTVSTGSTTSSDGSTASSDGSRQTNSSGDATTETSSGPAAAQPSTTSQVSAAGASPSSQAPSIQRQITHESASLGFAGDKEPRNEDFEALIDIGQQIEETEVLGTRIERADGSDDGTNNSASTEAPETPSVLAQTGAGILGLLSIATILIALGLVPSTGVRVSSAQDATA